MPFPDIQLIEWHNDNDLCEWKIDCWSSLIMIHVTESSICPSLEGDLLLNFAMHCDPNSCMNEGSKERDSFDSKDSRKKTHRCSDGRNFPDRNLSMAFSRRNAFKYTKSADKLALLREKMKAFDGSCALLKNNRRHTVRVVVMGDNRVLGRLAQVYHTIRLESFHKNKANT